MRGGLCVYLCVLIAKGLFTRREAYPSKCVTLALVHFLFFFLRRVYKEARATLASGLTFSLINPPDRVNPATRVNSLNVS